MLKKLDKYIIRKFLLTFFFAVLVFSLIAGVVDFSDHLDNFLRSNAPVKKIIFEYYLHFIPYISAMLFPMYSLIAVIFFTSRMAFNSEIISMLNAGMSFGRLLRPYMIAASILTALGLLLNTLLIPMGSKVKTKFENEYVYRKTDRGKTLNVHLFLSEDSKIFIKRYLKRDSTAKDVMLETFKDKELHSILFADKIKALPDGRTWEFYKYYTRTFNGLREEIEEGDTMRMEMNLKPEDFVAYDNAKDAMTSSELLTHISRQRSRSAGGTQAYEVEFHRRIAQPFLIIILTIIGMSLSARKTRGGMGFNIALGVGLGSVYIFLFQFSTTLVINGTMPPWLGVWLPSILFTFVAMYLVKTAQK